MEKVDRQKIFARNITDLLLRNKYQYGCKICLIYRYKINAKKNQKWAKVM